MRYIDYQFGEDIFLYILGGLSLLTILFSYVKRGTNVRSSFPRMGLVDGEKVFFATPYIKFKTYITVQGKRLLFHQGYGRMFISNLRVSSVGRRFRRIAPGFWFKDSSFREGALAKDVRYEGDILSFRYKDVLVEKEIEYMFREDVPELHKLLTKLNGK